jgi:hypothetical protein
MLTTFTSSDGAKFWSGFSPGYGSLVAKRNWPKTSCCADTAHFCLAHYFDWFSGKNILEMGQARESVSNVRMVFGVFPPNYMTVVTVRILRVMCIEQFWRVSLPRDSPIIDAPERLVSFPMNITPNLTELRVGMERTYLAVVLPQDLHHFPCSFCRNLWNALNVSLPG